MVIDAHFAKQAGRMSTALPLGARRLSKQPKPVIAHRRRQHAGDQVSSTSYLQSRSVRPATALRYTSAADEFVTWCRTQNFPILEQDARDKAMTAYVHALFFKGEPLYSARVALYGFAWKVGLNLKDPLELHGSKMALKGYTVAAPDQQRDPLPWDAALLIAQNLAERNTLEGRSAARAVIVMFDGYFRPSEFLGLKGGDVTVLKQRGLVHYPSVTVRLAPSHVDDGSPAPLRAKSGQYDDTIVIGDSASRAAGRALAHDVVVHLKKHCSGLRRLCDLSLARLDTLFKSAVEDLGLQRLRVTPHCCRHGGASTDYSGGHRSLDQIQRHGRWLAVASVRRYEKTGRLARQFSFLSQQHVRDAKLAETRLRHLLFTGL